MSNILIVVFISLLSTLSALQARAAEFVVTSTNDSGPGSFRQAIVDANDTPGQPHRIVFDIAGNGVHVIRPQTPLPFITRGQVEIDGYSQPGSQPNTLETGSDAVLRIALDGVDLGFDESVGLVLQAAQGSVRGLLIQRFVGGVFMLGDGGETSGNFVNLAASGEVGFLPLDRNGDGFPDPEVAVAITGSGNRVGGQLPADRNVLLGKVAATVLVQSGQKNIIENNYIGTDAAGLNALGAGLFGGQPIGARGISAGPAAESLQIKDNVVAGLGQHGIEISGPGGAPAGHQLARNRIGLAADGQGVLGVGLDPGGPFHGVLVDSASNIDVAENVIAGAGGDGMRILGAGVTGVSLRGNRIFANAGLGIDLGADGVTVNDPLDTDAGPNGLQNFPEIIAAARVEGKSGQIELQALLHSSAESEFSVEFFESPECDPSGHGQGTWPLGRVEGISTDGDGNLLIKTVLAEAGPEVLLLTAVATAADGSSSEFSACFEVDAAPEPLPDPIFSDRFEEQ